MIVVNMPLKREYVKELLHGQTYEGITFELVRQENMKMFFHATEDTERAASVVKKVIKESPLGPALFFMVSHEE